jgi:hypothetical protein
MLSLVHTPFASRETVLALGLSIDWYKFAIGRGALKRSYSDTNDSLQRLQSHNIADMLHFTVLSSLGWPERGVDILEENADYLFDVIAEIWEEADDKTIAQQRRSELRDADFVRVFLDGVNRSIDVNFFLDANEKAALIRKLQNICETVSLIKTRAVTKRAAQSSGLELSIEN